MFMQMYFKGIKKKTVYYSYGIVNFEIIHTHAYRMMGGSLKGKDTK